MIHTWSRRAPARSLDVLADTSWALLLALCFLRAGEARQVFTEGTSNQLALSADPEGALAEHFSSLGDAVGLELWPAHLLDDVTLDPQLVTACVELVDRIDWMSWTPEAFGEFFSSLRLLRPEEDGSSEAVELTEDIASRKARGVYYTPPSVAGELAARALAPWLDEPGGDQERALVVLDPACGAGALLIAAARLISRRWPEDAATERTRRVAASLRGVEIDPSAALLARCALALEVAGGAPERGDDEHFAALRALAGCVTVADTLAEGARLPAPVDVILANPPYVMTQEMSASSTFDAWARARFVSARYKIDLYLLFFELALRHVRPGGRVAMLTPRSWLKNKHAAEFRAWVLGDYAIESISTYEWSVFTGASVEPMICVLTRGAAAEDHACAVSVSEAPGALELVRELEQRLWRAHKSAEIDLTHDAETLELLESIESAGVPLGSICDAYFGVQTLDRKTWVRVDPPDESTWAPCCDGADVSMFGLRLRDEFVCTDASAIKSGGKPTVYARERIVVRQIGARPIAAIAPAGVWALNTIYNVWPRDGAEPYSSRFLLGVIASRLIGWYWGQRFWDQKRTFPKIKKASLLAIPVPVIDFDDPTSRASYDEVCEVVGELEGAVEALAEAESAQDRARGEATLEELRRHLDGLIAELFGVELPPE